MNFRHGSCVAAVGLVLALPARSEAQAMLTQVDSPHAFGETVQRIEPTIAARGLTLFVKVDHSAAAASAGLTLRPTTLLDFGNPKGGTPIMQAQPTAAIDLPLKALVWQGDDGKVSVAVNAAEYYLRHGLSPEQAKPLASAVAVVEAALKWRAEKRPRCPTLREA